MSESTKIDYEKIAAAALSQPGKVNACYSSFHHYSLGNQWLAAWQLPTPEPINTYKGWLALGRQVKKGEKAISLIMPVTIKDEANPDKAKTIFVARKNWFGLSQTDGAEYTPEPIPGFDIATALAGLGITQEPYKMVNGNCQGYAMPDKQVIAINPIASDPTKTTFHEIAHCLLHDGAQLADSGELVRSVKEVEAELTAYLISAALGLADGLDYSRQYIQSWMKDASLEKVRFSKVYAAADKILKAGKTA